MPPATAGCLDGQASRGSGWAVEHVRSDRQRGHMAGWVPVLGTRLEIFDRPWVCGHSYSLRRMPEAPAVPLAADRPVATGAPGDSTRFIAARLPACLAAQAAVGRRQCLCVAGSAGRAVPGWAEGAPCRSRAAVHPRLGSSSSASCPDCLRPDRRSVGDWCSSLTYFPRLRGARRSTRLLHQCALSAARTRQCANSNSFYLCQNGTSITWSRVIVTYRPGVVAPLMSISYAPAPLRCTTQTLSRVRFP